MNTNPRSNNELNRIIAEWCGWKPSEGEIAAAESWASITEPPEWVDPKPPNYCADLNAVHEVEGKILEDADLGYAYDCALNEVVQPLEDGILNFMKLWHAEARQRAEALVRVIEEGNREGDQPEHLYDALRSSHEMQ